MHLLGLSLIFFSSVPWPFPLLGLRSDVYGLPVQITGPNVKYTTLPTIALAFFRLR